MKSIAISSIGIQNIGSWLQSLPPSLCTGLRFKNKKKEKERIEKKEVAEGPVLSLKEIKAKVKLGSKSCVRQKLGMGHATQSSFGQASWPPWPASALLNSS